MKKKIAGNRPSTGGSHSNKPLAPRLRSILIGLLLCASATAAILSTQISSAESQKQVPHATAQNLVHPRSTADSIFDSLFQSPKQPKEMATVQQPAQQPQQVEGKPQESRLTKAQREFRGDVRNLPDSRPEKIERPEFEEPEPHPQLLASPAGVKPSAASAAPINPSPSAAAPAPDITFDGLDFNTWGAGHPTDQNGDVGPTYYIQTINTSIGIFRKSDGFRVAAFTFNTFMSQGSFGNFCDTNNFGDPVVLYDTFEDRWMISDFAFTVNGSGVPNSDVYQCVAVSKSGDPVVGGWNFYSVKTANNDNFPDYPKFGVWPDGIYYSANMFGPGTGGPSFQYVRVYALNKAQMYAGAPFAQVVSFNVTNGDFTVVPSNARLQTGTPPTGRPNLFISTWLYLNALTVYKFHVDWTNIPNSTFTGPNTPLNATSWPAANVPNAATPGNNLDVLQIRAMVQNQYSNISGAESLWITHTVRRANTSGTAHPRWYQVDVTAGAVAANTVQGTTWDPDGANTYSRYMPSLEVDRLGDMAIGYSRSNSTTNPQIKYAGRLAADPINTFSQTEQTLIDGTGTQTGACGSQNPCIRWGDYSAMTLDPNGCSFWYTNGYFATNGLNDLTRIGSFKFPGCTNVGAGGTLQGTVTTNPGGTPISGATVALGSRTTTTDGSGFYQFLNLPAGTYPSETASAPGFNSQTVNSIVINDSATTVQNFSLTSASTAACLTDTSQGDFRTGQANNVDPDTSPGNVVLAVPNTIDQSYTVGTNTGMGPIGAATWQAQTFTPAISGALTRADVQIFCSGCTGTTPNITVAIRNTSGGLPIGGDLATATIPGFASGVGAWFTVNFALPTTVTSGTQYALILRAAADPSAGIYFWIRANPGTYAGGQRVSTADSGGTWTADSTKDFNFKTYVGYVTSGNLVSSVKDSNPAPGLVTRWTTLSWTASVPANTSVKFQAAGSNNANGPFNFVGPDGTAGTFFTTSGASLSQFSGMRYMEWKAFLSTTDPNVTPTLNDVTLCFVNCSNNMSITCPGSISKFTDSGQFTATVNPGLPVVVGGCSPAVTGVRNDGKALNAPYPIGVTVITWTATDGFGNTASCGQSIAVMPPSGQRRKP